MFKKIVLSTIVLGTLSSSLFAAGSAIGESTARLTSLGLSNTQLSDYSNIWANAAYIQEQKNSIFFQGTGADGFGGVVKEFGFGTMGLFSSRNGSFGLTYGGTLISPVTPDNNIDIFYGKSLNKNMDLGVRTSYRYNAQSATTSQASTELELEVGVNLKKMNLDVAFSFGLPSASDSANTTTNVDGSSLISAVVRHHAKSVLSVLEYSIETDKRTDVGTLNVNQTTSTIDGSSTYTKKISKKTTAYYNIAYTSLTTTNVITATTSTTTRIPLVAAIESKTTENWIVRASAITNLYASTSTNLGSTTAANADNVNVGFGYHTKDFQIDTSVTIAGSTFSRVSAIYKF